MPSAELAARAALIAAAAVVERSLQTAGKNRRDYEEHLTEQAIRNGGVEGTLKLQGPGEARATLYFPLEFLEKPTPAATLEINEDQLTDGDFPIYSATVYDWITKGRPGQLSYVGVKLAVMVMGSHGPSTLHYSFRGQTFTNPTGYNTSVTGVL